jgi:hypothetical protein
MNLLSRVLPDFSARLCGRSIGALLFRCQAGSSSPATLRAPAQAAAWSVRNTPSLPVDCSSEFSGKRRPVARSPAAPSLSAAEPLAVADALREPVGSFRRFPLSFLGDRWRGDIDLDQLRVVGDAADERSPCEIRRGPHWKKSGQCQASHNCSGGSKEEPDFS